MKCSPAAVLEIPAVLKYFTTKYKRVPDLQQAVVFSLSSLWASGAL